jgi:hypothetical protein
MIGIGTRKSACVSARSFPLGATDPPVPVCIHSHHSARYIWSRTGLGRSGGGKVAKGQSGDKIKKHDINPDRG